MRKIFGINPLQLKPTPPTSNFEGPFSELASASATTGGKLRIMNRDTEF